MARTADRGYGGVHQSLRRRYAKVVDRGEAYCAKCGQWISPSEPWDLGHSPFDRGKYLGPMHQRCNRDTRFERSLRRPGVFRADWW
jgi:hypothetical protein